jgi:hypothetical protein
MPSFEEVELGILRRMTAEQKLHTVQALWEQAWQYKAAGVRMSHPDWPDQRVAEEVRAYFIRDRV